jgi:signal transduction histidine kinase
VTSIMGAVAPGGRVSVRTGAREGRSALPVSNSGPVVPAGEVGRLFEPFQRPGAGHVHERDGGHGLGLATVRPSPTRTARP